MANIPSQPGRRAPSLPEVPRPSSRIWQPLEAESICWEGQVLVVGGNDLPALLVVTRERLAIISNGQIALEVPRDWLRPAAELAAENGIRLFISPEENLSKPEPMLLRARAGRGAAAELIAVLTGRPLPMQPGAPALQIPNWREKIGASAPVALPSLDDDAPEQPAAAGRSSWPPVEQEGVIARPKPRQLPQGRPMQTVADQRRGNMPVPTPVPSEISRAARKQGTRADGFTIADDATQAPPVPMHRSSSRSHHIVTWTLRAAIVLMLLGTIGYFGRDRIEAGMYDIRDRLPTDVQRTLGIADEKPSDIAITTAPNAGETGDGTNGASTADQPQEEQPAAAPTETAVETEVAQIEPSEVPVQQTDPTANIGGPTGELPPTNNAEDVTAEPTATLETIETEIPTEAPVIPTEAPVEPTAVPTEIPVEPTAVPTEIPVEPTTVPTEEPTAVPTEEPTPEPTAVPTEEPTAAPTVEPTAVPTEEPTETPVEQPTEESTPEPTGTPVEEPTAEPTVEPTEESTPAPTEAPTVAPEPTLEPQEPSVLPETTPEQAVVANGFRFTLEGASIGDTVPELPQINSVGGYGEWVVLSVYGQNMSADAQVFDMSTFKLFADGQEILVDVGNAWVSGLLGNTPAYGNTDAIQWAPGESHRFTLTFLAPPEAETLMLQAGDETIDLSPALESPQPLLSEGTPVESDFIEATVVEVIDAETIVIDVDGVRQQVRYLSVDAPTGDACYAAEATEANRSLVQGQTVTLERQATDIDARGNWVRDVWVTNDAGVPVLVSQQLVLAGAAQTDVSVPNTRFAGWLQSSQAAAQDADAGMWGICGE
jgi:hypothetical protein